MVIFFLIIQVADNLIRIEAKEAGVSDEQNAGFSLFPSSSDIFRPKVPEFLGNQPVHFLKAGHDIDLEGTAQSTITDASVTTFAVQPPNFVGTSPIPKVVVAVGDEVKAGDVLFFDKKRPKVKHVAPVSGEVIAISRGEKRSIKEVVILADKK